LGSLCKTTKNTKGEGDQTSSHFEISTGTPSAAQAKKAKVACGGGYKCLYNIVGKNYILQA
jgi:hypothetical protein